MTRAGTGILRTLFAVEIRRLLRDRRMLVIAVVVPLVLFPVILSVMRFVSARETTRLEEATYLVALDGDAADWARPILARALELEALGDDTTRRSVRFEDRTGMPDPSARLRSGELHVVVQALSADAYRAVLDEEEAASDAATDGASEADEPWVATPALRLRYRAQSDFSRNAAERLRQRLVEVRRERRDSLFESGGFPVDPEAVAVVVRENVASPEREGGALLGLALTPFLLFLMLSGGSIAAVDAITGEKERGSLETLLTTAATRREIVVAKQLAIIVVGLAVAVINLLNLLVYVVLDVFELPEGLAVSLSMLDLGLLLVLLLPITVLVSSSLMLVSGYARSYKEYQIYFFPLFLAFLGLTLPAMLPGMDLRSAIALAPVAGIGVAVREIMVGEYDWPFIALAFASTTAVAVYLARLTERALSTERLIAGVEMDEADLVGGPALFPKQVLRWFAVMWALFFVANLWFGAQLGLRGQILVNLVVIFLGATVVMIRRYRLPVREALALRAPPAAAWPAVVIGVPSAWLAGVGVSRFVNAYVFPVPRSTLESMADFFVANDMPVVWLVFFLALMPGVIEELAFRGLLVYGLRKKLGPLALCLAVGAIFGMFHVSLARIVSTGFLGAVLTGVVLLTGSIYPAMAWHFLNNALGVVPARLGWLTEDFELPIWSHFAGLAGLALAFWILWRARRPYPGLQGSKPAPFRDG